MRFHVINLGCKVNRVESDAFAACFLECGCLSVDKQDADVIVVNTCMVTGEAEKKTRKAIRRALRENDRACIVVTGCAAVMDPRGLEALDDRVIVVADKTKIYKAIAVQGVQLDVSLLASDEKDGTCQGRFLAYDVSSRLRKGAGFVSRTGMKIQDGCNNACTFCIVHHARGRAWSRDKASILKETHAYEDAGVRELVLTGINIGSYQYEKEGLTDLLETLLSETSKLRFRISSIEPCDVEDKLIELVASSNGRICRHFHLPLQSGSDKVLQEMARPYRANDYRSLVDRIYSQIPNMSLSTDLIVGFPGETEEDFECSFELVEYCQFSKVHIFPYSKREGTPAAARCDHVESGVKAQRVDRINALAQKLRKKDLLKRCDTSEFVLVENDGYGTTESYHKVLVPPTAKPGDMLKLKL